MINTRILDDIEAMFRDDPNIAIERGEDYITLSQAFTNNVHLSPKLFEKSHSVFSHTVTLYDDDSYKTIDIIKNKSADFFNFTSSEYKGILNMRGFFYGLGQDMNTGETGLIRQEWNTEDIKAPVREYMEQTGLTQRPSVWWTGKRIAMAFAIGWGGIFLLFGTILLILKMKGML